VTEDQLEQEALGWLADVGWQHRYGPELAPDGRTPERSDYPSGAADRDVERVLEHR
jgi:type I restriction enzyme R subunit